MNTKNRLLLLEELVPLEEHRSGLEKAKITECTHLLEKGKDANGRAWIAAKTGLVLGDIERWVLQADLLQLNFVMVPPLATEENDALKQVDIDDLDDVARMTLAEITEVAQKLAQQLGVKLTAEEWEAKLRILALATLTPKEATMLTQAGMDGLCGLARMLPAGITTMAQELAQPSSGWLTAEDWERKLSNHQPQAQAFIERAGPDGVIVTHHTHNYLIVSDLHIGQGLEIEEGKVNRNEDFLYDEDFANFLFYHQQKREAASGLGTTEDRPWRLVINGDVVDFLQVTGTPARGYEELKQKADRLLGEEAKPEEDCYELLTGDPTVSRFFDRINYCRQRLCDLKDTLVEKYKDTSVTDRTQLRCLIAEAKILLAAGDSRLDTNRLTDLEEMLRIASELEKMSAILKEIRGGREPSHLISGEEQLSQVGCHQVLGKQPPHHDNSENRPNTSDRQKSLSLLKEKVAKGSLEDTEINDLEQQIQNAEEQLRQAKFTTELLELILELVCVFSLSHSDNPCTDDVPWTPHHLEGSVFDRYRDVFIRYRRQRRALGRYKGLSQKFEVLFKEVPQWEVGQGDPYQLSYENMRWGLGSSEVENVWRMCRIFSGHLVFFQALAWFLASGNEIVIQTGNHDIELFWDDVRKEMREVLKLAYDQLDSSAWQARVADFASDQCPAKPSNGELFERIVAERLAFTHWLYYEPGVVYIEHGCQYETANSWSTHLDPRYVGTVAEHWIRTVGGEVEPGRAEQEKLFWPWGSLIVRYMFNQFEQTHPFADQIKPMTRYFTWAFSRDFFRTLGLLILSLPGFGRVLNQLLDRGVVEGWFGPTGSLVGVGHIILRGASTWGIWMGRFFRFLPSDWSAAEWRKLRWPVLPWHAWEHIVHNDKERRSKLARRLPDLWHDSTAVEPILKIPFNKSSSAAPSAWNRIGATLLEIVLQVGLVIILFAFVQLLTGWRIETYFVVPVEVGVPRPVCQALDGLRQVLVTLPSSLPLTLLSILLLLLILPVTVWARWQLAQFGWQGETKAKRVGIVVSIVVPLVIGLASVVYLGFNVYCGFAYYHIPQSGPWASLTLLPMWLFWLFVLSIAAFLPRREAEKRWRQKSHRSLNTWLFQQSVSLYSLAQKWWWRWIVFIVRAVLLAIIIVPAFIAYYGQPLDWPVVPGYLPWVLLLVGLCLAVLWWGANALGLFFVGTAALGLSALVANGLLALDISGPGIGWWLLGAIVVAGLTALFTSFVLRWVNRLAGLKIVVAGLKIMVVGLKVITLGAFLAWILTWANGFNSFYALSGWTWLPLWMVWGFIGLWLLESKENPFSGEQRLEGWLGDRLGRQWSWLHVFLFNTFTFISEIGLVVLALGAVAQLYHLRSEPLPGFLQAFSGSPGRVIQVLLAAGLLLAIGSGLRSLLGWLQTEDSVLRLHEWQARRLWPFKLIVGLSFIGLAVISLWLVSGGQLLNDLSWGWLIAGILVMALIGWRISISRPERTASPSRVAQLAVFILLLGGIVLLCFLWFKLTYALGAWDEERKGPGELAILAYPIWIWFVSTLLLFLGLWVAGWKRPSPEKPTEERTWRQVWSRVSWDHTWWQVWNGTSWGLFLLAGMLATAVLVRAASGRSFVPLVQEKETSLAADKIEYALFRLRLERALRLSYTVTGYERDTDAYLQRLRDEDGPLGAYLTVLQKQPSELAQRAQALSELADQLDDLPGTESHAQQVHDIGQNIQHLPDDSTHPVYETLQEQVNHLLQLLKERREYTGEWTEPETRLTEHAVELTALSEKWKQLAENTTDRCHPDPVLDAANMDCEGMVTQVWQARLQPDDADLSAFQIELKEQAGKADQAIAAVVAEVKQMQPGWWEQVTLWFWLRLRGIDHLGVLARPVILPEVTATNLETATTQLTTMADQRQTQMAALWAWGRMAYQRDLTSHYALIVAWLIVTLALIGIVIVLLVIIAVHKLPLASALPHSLDAVEQVKRVAEVARRKQTGFVRKFARTVTTILSFGFGLGLVVGASLVVSGLLVGDVQTFLQSGAVITVLSWLGRRLVLFLPADIGYGGGYLAQAASEIRVILSKGKVDKTQSLYPVPYFLFGHDHIPAFELLPSAEEEAKPRKQQWYVNTGAWVQAYTGEVRYRREDEEHPIFVEIIPGPTTTGVGQVPRLLRWDRATGQPSRLNHLVAYSRETLLKRMVKTGLRRIGLQQDYTWPR